MIDIVDVEQTIDKLEHSKTTYQSCATLADLYTVRNEYYNHKKAKDNAKMEYSFADRSDFVSAFMSATPESAFAILDEHMNCVKALYPKEYNLVLKRLIASIKK